MSDSFDVGDWLGYAILIGSGIFVGCQIESYRESHVRSHCESTGSRWECHTAHTTDSDGVPQQRESCECADGGVK